ncbi:MAG: hypothetical protein WAW41_04675 [Methylobacter sp.]
MPVLPLADRTIKTCKDASELQKRIASNMKAIRRTVPIIREAIEDEDEDFALEELTNLESQTRGLSQLIKEAKANGCLLNQES